MRVKKWGADGKRFHQPPFLFLPHLELKIFDFLANNPYTSLMPKTKHYKENVAFTENLSLQEFCFEPPFHSFFSESQMRKFLKEVIRVNDYGTDAQEFYGFFKQLGLTPLALKDIFKGVRIRQAKGHDKIFYEFKFILPDSVYINRALLKEFLGYFCCEKPVCLVNIKDKHSTLNSSHYVFVFHEASDFSVPYPSP